VNAFIDLNNSNFGVSYVTFDNIEMLGFYWKLNPTFNTCAHIIGSASTNVTLDHLYIHDWLHDPYTEDGSGTPTGARDLSCSIVMGTTQSPFNQGSVLQNSIVDGSASAGGLGDSSRIYLWPNIKNNVITHIPNAIIQKASGEISGNDISFVPSSFDISQCPPLSGSLCPPPTC
jgi:hypothetical protein